MSLPNNEPAPVPDVDYGALAMADIAWIECPGGHADKMTAAIRAYLWAQVSAEATGFYPSLGELRAALIAPSAADSY